MLKEYRSILEKECNCLISDDEMTYLEKYADKKLDWIISREGDQSGLRNKPWYRLQLMKERLEVEKIKKLRRLPS